MSLIFIAYDYFKVVCDDNMMLLDAFTGWPGSVHDSRVLRNSSLFRSADQKFNDETHLLGDGGYPLLTYVKLNNHFKKKFNISLAIYKLINIFKVHYIYVLC